MNHEQLIKEATEMLDRAYVPYSNFPVGAALITEDGKVYRGCNIENAAYPVSCCAERTAIFKAISEGERDFQAMAVIAHTSRPVPPCGSCRQVMSEFFNKEMPIYICSKNQEYKEVRVEELLPFSFNQEDLSKGQEK
ncbi:cytidine deaminase [Tenuibacillus multivorans]|uniref:Cytidine deaminase n=1 Tax=Tenuibacillus multivorans TaxID=237069 RepID=A0A1H0CRQ0_9BACI|nr:cytidine deaminase [Tenuibacillus multivorans]GEL76190.1 cytidine deaminase [Tenuibacillus multivorans]SDN60505.1 cytidine deaminase [Tenuibacillus multivorans]